MAEAAVQTELVDGLSSRLNSSSSMNGTATAANHRPLTPSTRIAALNLVSDLLQKVAVSSCFITTAPIIFSAHPSTNHYSESLLPIPGRGELRPSS